MGGGIGSLGGVRYRAANNSMEVKRHLETLKHMFTFAEAWLHIPSRHRGSGERTLKIFQESDVQCFPNWMNLRVPTFAKIFLITFTELVFNADVHLT